MQWTFPTSFDRPQTWHSSTNRVNYSRVTPWIKKIRHHLAWFTLRSLTHGEQEAFFITYMFTVKNHFHVLFFGHDSCITDFSDNLDTRWIKLEILEKDENEKQIWFASGATFISSDLSIWTLGHHLISLIIFEIIRWIKNIVAISCHSLRSWCTGLDVRVYGTCMRFNWYDVMWRRRNSTSQDLFATRGWTI